MARLIIKKFDPTTPVYARKRFTANGRKYVPGSEFDWRKLAINQRRVKQMYESGLVHHGNEKPVELTNRQRNMAESTPVEEITIADESYPKHAGGPWYELSNGERIRGLAAAETAEAEL